MRLIHIFLLIECLVVFKINAFPCKNSICENKGNIQNIIIGGIREPGHWFYPDVDKIYDANDKDVLIINDFAIANPDIQVKANNEALPVLKESLSCLVGSIHQVVFEHVGYGLQKKHFDRLIQFFSSLLKPDGQIAYISYRVPFSDFYSQVHQSQEQRPMGLNFCRLLGIPEPKVVYKAHPLNAHVN